MALLAGKPIASQRWWFEREGQHFQGEARVIVRASDLRLYGSPGSCSNASPMDPQKLVSYAAYVDWLQLYHWSGLILTTGRVSLAHDDQIAFPRIKWPIHTQCLDSSQPFRSENL